MRIRSHEEVLSAMREYIEAFEKLALENPKEAKEVARESLIKTGVLNEDGSHKESIVTRPSQLELYDFGEDSREDKNIIINTNCKKVKMVERRPWIEVCPGCHIRNRGYNTFPTLNVLGKIKKRVLK